MAASSSSKSGHEITEKMWLENVVLIMRLRDSMDRGVCDKHSPRTFRNFVELSQRSYYDKVPCHKIIKDFIVQGGDPTGTGRGGQSIYEEKIERWIIKNWKQRTPRRMALFTGWYQEHYVCLLLHEIASNRFVYRLVPKIKPSRRDAMMHQPTGGEDTSVPLHLILGKSSSFSPSYQVWEH